MSFASFGLYSDFGRDIVFLPVVHSQADLSLCQYGVTQMQHAIRGILAGFCLVLLLGACTNAAEVPSTPTVSTRFNHSYDFSGVHKIAIQPISRTAVSTIQITDAQISRIDEALTLELQSRGFQVVQSNADADMFLVWHLVTEAPMDTKNLNSISQYNCLNCAAGDSAQEPKYIKGTFVVEMVDPLQLQSEWRATLVSRILNDQGSQLSTQNRDAAAKTVLAQFPPSVNKP